MSNPTKGRMNRSTYLLAHIVYLAIWGGFFAVASLGIQANISEGAVANLIAFILWIVIIVGGVWVGAFATIRRLHDMGLSGWWALLFHTLSASVILLFLPAQPACQHQNY